MALPNSHTSPKKTTEELFQVLSFAEHFKKTSMYFGSFEPTVKEIWLGDTIKFYRGKVTLSLAFLKCVDELVCNAIDHKADNLSLVTLIKATFNGESFTLFNNGPGFLIEKHKKANNIYVPELLMCHEYSGSNFDKDDKSSKIGQNGIGLKGVVICSERITLTTLGHDLAGNKFLYKQTVEKQSSIVHPPEITPQPKTAEEYTLIEFVPDWKLFGGKSEYMAAVTARIMFMAAWFDSFANQVACPRVKVIYNKTELYSQKPTATEWILSTIATSPIYSGRIYVVGLPWDVSCSLASSDATPIRLALVNGIPTNEGDHFLVVIKSLTEQIGKLFHENYGDDAPYNQTIVEKNVHIIMSCRIERPTFDAQIKERLTIPIRHGNTIERVPMDTKILDGLLNDLKNIMVAKLITEEQKQLAKAKKKRIIDIDGYWPAANAGTSQSKNCTLFLVEGLSAKGFVDKALKSKNLPVNKDYFGIFSLGGVITNVRKKIRVWTKKDGQPICDTNGMPIIKGLANLQTQKIGNLMQVLNIRFENNYADGPVGLSYGTVVSITDADVDGANITALVLNFFQRFWPTLFKYNFIYKMVTPVIRLVPTSGADKEERGLSFYFEEEFRQWCQKNSTKGFSIKYIKGLDSNTDKFIPVLFKKYYEQICRFTLDQQDNEKFEILFGRDADKRKLLLSTPVTALSTEIRQMPNANRVITCGSHLDIETKNYALENLQRKLPHLYDGLRPAPRKVITYALLYHSNTFVKLFIRSAEIAAKMLYHHGGASLEQTIVNMTQSFPGGTLYPMYCGNNEFGTRNGDKAGAARYIFSKPNNDMILSFFPKEDLHLLKFTSIDGEKAEPDYFIPVLPLSILESITIPAHGWKSEIIGREFSAVVKLVRGMIDATPETIMALSQESEELILPERRGFQNVHIYKYNTDPLNPNVYICGKYQILNEYSIKITEIPIGWTTDVVVNAIKIKYGGAEKSKEKSKIKTVKKECLLDRPVDDRSTNTEVDIRIYFNTKLTDVFGVDPIPSDNDSGITPIHRKLHLVRNYHSCLNFYGPDNTVVEAKSFQQVLKLWYEARKNLYIRRHRFMTIITQNWIRLLQEMIRFLLGDFKAMNEFSDEEAIDKYLESKDYKKFNKSALESYGDYDETNIEKAILDGSSYTYLTSLPFSTAIKKKTEDLQKKLNKYIERLEFLQNQDTIPFEGATQWKTELNSCVKAVEEGIRRNWDFTD